MYCNCNCKYSRKLILLVIHVTDVFSWHLCRTWSRQTRLSRTPAVPPAWGWQTVSLLTKADFRNNQRPRSRRSLWPCAAWSAETRPRWRKRGWWRSSRTASLRAGSTDSTTTWAMTWLATMTRKNKLSWSNSNRGPAYENMGENGRNFLPWCWYANPSQMTNAQKRVPYINVAPTIRYEMHSQPRYSTLLQI